jgi:hypothetical protein
MSANET